MNNNPGVFTEDMPLKKLFLFIFLLTICFQKNILRHDYLLADEVISHKKKSKSVKCFSKPNVSGAVFLTLPKRAHTRILKSGAFFFLILHFLIFSMGYHLISYISTGVTPQ